jgi:hypothetical protein
LRTPTWYEPRAPPPGRINAVSGLEPDILFNIPEYTGFWSEWYTPCSTRTVIKTLLDKGL